MFLKKKIKNYLKQLKLQLNHFSKTDESEILVIRKSVKQNYGENKLFKGNFSKPCQTAALCWAEFSLIYNLSSHPAEWPTRPTIIIVLATSRPAEGLKVGMAGPMVRSSTKQPSP